MKKFLKVIAVIFIVIISLVMWAAVAMDYGDSVAAGTYIFKSREESSTLVLDPNHTFQQTRRIGGVEQKAIGTWQHVGEGGYSFSKEFLAVTGDEPEPDGTTFCDMHKLLGVLPSLRLRQYHVLWYGKSSSGSSLVGTYKGDESGVIATLVLNADHSFAQTLTRNDITKDANGSWTQDSRGTVSFSKEFLKTSGDSLSRNEIASSMDPQGSNLQIEISLAEHLPEPIFRKRFGF